MAITLREMLIEAELITAEQFDDALRNLVIYGGKIGTSLIELGYLEEEDLARFLSKKLSVPYVHAHQLLNIPDEIIQLISREIALKYKVIPLQLDQKRLSLVMADPADLRAIDEIAFITGYIIRPLVAPEVRLIQALGKYYQMDIDLRYRQIIEKIAQRAEAARAEQAAPPASAAAPAPTESEFPAESGPMEPGPSAEVAFDRQERPSGLAPPSEPSPDELAIEEIPEAEIIEEEGGAWAERVEAYSIDDVSRTLAAATDREEIAEIILRYLVGQGFPRVALFLVRGQTVSGWKARAEGEEPEDFHLLHIPLDRPSALKTVAEGKSLYLGPLADTPMNVRMLEALGGGRPETVLLIPLSIAGRVVNIAYIEGGHQALSECIAELQKLLGKASLAFEVLILREKILLG